MSVWSKIWQGIKVIGPTVKDMFMGAISGAEAGEIAGPIGAGLGAMAGVIVGAVSHFSSIWDWTKTLSKDPNTNHAPELTSQDIYARAHGGQSSAVISYAAANPRDPESKIVMQTLSNVQQGMSWRSAYTSAGGHQFGRALSDAAIQSVVNKAAGVIGVSPTFALMHGNGAVRQAASGGSTTIGRNGINNMIMGQSHVLAGQALSSSYSGSLT